MSEGRRADAKTDTGGHGGGCSDVRASRRTRPLAGVASLAAVGLALGIAAPAGAQPAAGGAFLDAQAASGRTAYGRSCASCHGTTLRGAVHGPDLTGPSFLSNWGSQTAAALYEYVRAEMPPGLGGSLSSGTYLSIVAYLLQVNGHAAGPQALTADAAGIVGEPGAAPARGAPATADASDAASADEPRDVDAVPALRAFVNREVSGFTPVTDELLRNPPAEDWLTWRRTRDWSWPSSAHRLRPCSATPTATPSRRRSRDVHDGLDRDEKRRPRAVHSRASAGTRSWSWFKYYDRAVVEVPRDVDRLDPAGVVRLLPGGDVAVATDQADAGMSRA